MIEFQFLLVQPRSAFIHSLCILGHSRYITNLHPIRHYIIVAMQFHTHFLLSLFLISLFIFPFLSSSSPVTVSVPNPHADPYSDINDAIRFIDYSTQCLNLNIPSFPFNYPTHPTKHQCRFEYSQIVFKSVLPPMDRRIRDMYFKLKKQNMEQRQAQMQKPAQSQSQAQTSTSSVAIPQPASNPPNPEPAPFSSRARAQAQAQPAANPNFNPLSPGAQRLRMKRLTIEDLKLPENWNYARGFLPFILTGAMSNWNLTHNWSIDAFNRTFGHIDVYFHPRYVTTGRGAGIRVSFSEAIDALTNTPEFGYIYWNPYFYDWKLFLSNMSSEFKSDFSHWLEDDEWIDQCLMREDYRVEFILRTAWKLVVFGAPGSGMYLHQDTLFTQSWQAHITGRKRWFVCDPQQSTYLYEGTVDAFKYEFGEMKGDWKGVYNRQYPLFQRAVCYDDIAETGDIVYYPPSYWHQTLNLGPNITLGLSGTMLNAVNYYDIAQQLVRDCDDPHSWFFSEMLCHQIKHYCLPWWDYKYGKHDIEYGILQINSTLGMVHQQQIANGKIKRTL